MKKRIIICGYPKSGNTWLTRLTAELVGCPVAGFWCHPFVDDIAEEGKDRNSEFECFKAHHNVQQMFKTFESYSNGTEKIIYITRDPRDILISALNYFKIPPEYLRLYKLMTFLPNRSKIYKVLFERDDYKINYMLNSILFGNSNIKWLKTPWHTHVEGYLNRSFLILKYENLIEDSFTESKKILDYLNLDKEKKEISLAIKNQSFEVKKKLFKKEKDYEKEKFLRKGKIGQWEETLTKKQTKLLIDVFGDVMERLNYI